MRNDLLYTKNHEWLKVENSLGRIGITDYAQEQLSDIVYVELPKVGNKVERNSKIGVVESVKSVSDIYSPISGEVIEVNNNLIKKPEIMNSSPYDDGWFALLKIKDLNEIQHLLKPEEYKALVQSL
ncbi:MAG: glycine cleavage system protein GcvH [Candidatus Thermoplasmatota archaeon]